MTAENRLDRLEASLTKSLAGFLAGLRSTKKPTTGNAMTIPTEVAEVLAEMRDRKVNHGKHTSPTLIDWADRIESALTKAEAVAEVVPSYVPSGKRVALNTKYQHLRIGTKLYTGPEAMPKDDTEAVKDRMANIAGEYAAELLALAHAPPAVPVESGRKPLSETMYRGPAHPEGHREQFLDRRCLAADNVPTESLGRDADYRHSTHHVHRGPESLPCYCAGTSDHQIGSETRPAEPVESLGRDADIGDRWIAEAEEDVQQDRMLIAAMAESDRLRLHVPHGQEFRPIHRAAIQRMISLAMSARTAEPVASVPDGFYLASFKHKDRGGAMMWWGPDNAGYTPDIEHAGIYTEITPGYHDSDYTVPVPVGFLAGCRIRRTLDPGDSKNRAFWSAADLRAAVATTQEGAAP